MKLETNSMEKSITKNYTKLTILGNKNKITIKSIIKEIIVDGYENKIDGTDSNCCIQKININGKNNDINLNNMGNMTERNMDELNNTFRINGMNPSNNNNSFFNFGNRDSFNDIFTSENMFKDYNGDNDKKKNNNAINIKSGGANISIENNINISNNISNNVVFNNYPNNINNNIYNNNYNNNANNKAMNDMMFNKQMNEMINNNRNIVNNFNSNPKTPNVVNNIVNNNQNYNNRIINNDGNNGFIVNNVVTNNNGTVTYTTVVNNNKMNGNVNMMNMNMVSNFNNTMDFLNNFGMNMNFGMNNFNMNNPMNFMGQANSNNMGNTNSNSNNNNMNYNANQLKKSIKASVNMKNFSDFEKKKLDLILDMDEFQFKNMQKYGNRKETECIICSEKFKGIDIIKAFYKCGHIFHKKCLLDWLKKNNNCPSCNHDLSDDIK